jgi:hypothetical protein
VKQDELARPRLLGTKIHRLAATTVAAWLLEHNVEGLDLPVLMKTEIADLVETLRSAEAP